MSTSSLSQLRGTIYEALVYCPQSEHGYFIGIAAQNLQQVDELRVQASRNPVAYLRNFCEDATMKNENLVCKALCNEPCRHLTILKETIEKLNERSNKVHEMLKKQIKNKDKEQ
jgi:hypothetical protein